MLDRCRSIASLSARQLGPRIEQINCAALVAVLPVVIVNCLINDSGQQLSLWRFVAQTQCPKARFLEAL